MTCFTIHQTGISKQVDTIENIGHFLFVDSNKQEQAGACCLLVCRSIYRASNRTRNKRARLDRARA